MQLSASSSIQVVNDDLSAPVWGVRKVPTIEVFYLSSFLYTTEYKQRTVSVADYCCELLNTSLFVDAMFFSLIVFNWVLNPLTFSSHSLPPLLIFVCLS